MGTKFFAEGYERDAEHPDWILFPRDSEFRKGLFTPEATQHPAKMQCFIVKAAMEYWGRPGMRVLDPFGGTGTTAIASMVGQGVQTTLIELEDEFMDMLAEMLEKWEGSMFIQPGQVEVLQGDCRRVMLELPENHYDMIITSPPYSVTAQVGKEVTQFTGILAERKAQMRRYGSSESSNNNIGRLNPFQFNMHMKLVYERALRVTKPGGLYVSVTKDSMNKGVRKFLSQEVIRTATGAGWLYEGEQYKWKAPGGLLQNVQKSKGLEVVLDEDILVFRKPV